MQSSNNKFTSETLREVTDQACYHRLCPQRLRSPDEKGSPNVAPVDATASDRLN
jgi:hypothetical protein